MSRLTFASVMLSALVLTPSLNGQCSAALFGSTIADPLVVLGNFSLPANCTVNFGGREVIFQSGSITGTTFTLLCAKLTVEPGFNLTSTNGGVITLNVAPSGPHDGSVRMRGVIDVRDIAWGGDVVVTCGASYLQTGNGGRILGQGTAAGADGGTATITADGPVLIDGDALSINLRGGNDAEGGTAILTSNTDAVDVLKRIDCSGGAYDGGSIALNSGTNVTVLAPLDVQGGGGSSIGFGWGGYVDITAGNDILLAGNILASGPTGTLNEGGGDGGWVTFVAGNNIAVGADITATGGVDGWGGFFDASAGGNYGHANGAINVRGTGTDAIGGDITIAAAGAVQIAGLMDAQGPSSAYAWGGTVEVAGELGVNMSGEVRVHSNTAGTIVVDAPRGGAVISGRLEADGRGSDASGGDVTLSCFGDMSVANLTIDVRGNGSAGIAGAIAITARRHVSGDANTNLNATGDGLTGGNAGSISIEGCQLSFPDNSRIRANGNMPGLGVITLTAHDVMTLGGDIETDTGMVILNNRLSAACSPQILTTAFFVPSTPLQTVQSYLSPCMSVLDATFTGTSQVSVAAGLPAQVNLSVPTAPNAPIIAGYALAPLPAIANDPFTACLGWSQIPFFTGPVAVFADYGYFGTPLPNSSLDAQGNWTAYGPVPWPGLVGLTTHVEVYVIDFSAENGLFHQPEMVSVTYVN